MSAAFTMKRRAELVEELEPLRMDDARAIRGPPGPRNRRTNRPAARRPQPLVGQEGPVLAPLRPERVVEVAYDHMENGARFRHTACFRRWRLGPTPESCTYAQLEEPVRYDLAEILAGPEGAARAPRGLTASSGP